MDVLSVLYWIGIILFCLLVLYATNLYYTWPYSMFENLGIPGPKPKPFIGTLTEFGKKGFHEIDTENINKYGSVVGTFEVWRPTLLISDIEMLKEIFIKDFDSFCDRPHLSMRGKMNNSVFDTHGEERFKRQRSLLSKYFSSGTMKMSVKTLNDILTRFIVLLDKKFENNEEIEAKMIANLYTMDAICTTAFGIEVDAINHSDSELVTKANELCNFDVKSIKMAISAFCPTLASMIGYFNIQAFDCTWFEKFVKSLLEKRGMHDQVAPDFVNVLLKAREDENKVPSEKPQTKGLSDDEIIANAVLFLMAGFDTTATSLAFLIYNLTVNEECQDKVYAEIQEIVGDEMPNYDNVQRLEYLEMCFQESMRIYPIAPRTTRQCVKDIVIKNVPIKKGVQVVLPIWYLHHNPEIYPEPEKFVPERFTSENKKDRDTIYHCPFGLGPRHCIGMRLAILEIKMCIVKILQKYKLKKNDQTQIPLKIKPYFTLAPKDGVWFSLEKR